MNEKGLVRKGPDWTEHVKLITCSIENYAYAFELCMHNYNERNETLDNHTIVVYLHA